MQVLVVGATGTLGRQVARACLDRGMQVRCIVRSPRKAPFLTEWGAEVVRGDLLNGDSLDYALEGRSAVIDCATARATDEQSIYTIDWDGKLNLLRRMEAAGIRRIVFTSILNAERHRSVPLMDIKYCTEQLLQQADFDHTILRPAGFMQGLIGTFAIPVLENQMVWTSGTNTPIAYMNSQDVARFAAAALERPSTLGGSYPVVGPRAWDSDGLIRLCESLSGKQAKVFRVSAGLIRFFQAMMSFFEPGLNIAERLAFAEVTGGGDTFDAEMTTSYADFGLDPADTATLENYLKEYYGTILNRLREMEVNLSREEKKKLPF
ncbi:MAG: NAD-dependent epimerase/dehydratase family protein [Aphanocapsa feldmannii 277cV]|uniref:NAD-dependent epimerase/dehydratase family protein n=2 Tax=Aphanocapsa feldmannii TaxID=192050 RepID=A0A524RLF4_9CHRO|nr:MAG: NAD-dependent epimerase/dehydratase family protein [Aphanocapsa feldmannii 277cV]TGH25768.1 MAG: NAD-dependent epimerase/dehydratase family protein [Aphanocapsa feldmannii 277cI]